MNNFNKHALSTLTVLVASTLALSACNRADREQARTEGRQATNQASAVVDDAALTTKVKAALLADDQVKGTQINVDSNRGTVKLTGTVDTADQVRRAEDVARGVQGVQRIENNLAASANAAPGMVPGTQPPGTSPASTPMPNNTTPPKPATAPSK
jgi:hyperosmotically inducible periplasmic protein